MHAFAGFCLDLIIIELRVGVWGERGRRGERRRRR